MARYNTFKYGSGQTYGELAANKYSVEPIFAYAQDYDEINLTWATPQTDEGVTIQTYKLLRSQYAYPETPEDGLVIWEDDFEPGKAPFVDKNNVSSGRFAFYSFWLQLDDDSWVLAGQTEVLVPAKHLSRIYPKFIDENNVSIASNILLQTTHERFLSYLPRVFTANDSPTGNLDEEGSLSKFLEGFSFTIDEFLTYGQLVLPGLSGRYSNSAIVKLQGDQLGVPEDTQGLTKNQKYFVRDAIYIYSRKGTLPGLTRFIKSLTGYVPTITVSDNIMLSLQNSTFYRSIGGWKATNNVVISALNTSDVPTTGVNDLVTETNWVAKIDCTSSASSVYLGNESPITQGIPVVAGEEYSFSYWVKRDSSSGSITTENILWYDQRGNKIGDVGTTSTGQTVTTSWVRKTFTKTAPADAKFASIEIGFSTGTVFYLDRVQVALSDITTYSEARAIKIYLNPGDSFAETRLNKVPRLNNEIVKYLPINTSYIITSEEGLESSGITS